MALNTRGTNTFVEGLHKLLGQLTDLKVIEDADLPFIIGIETQILQRLRDGADKALQPSAPSAGPGLASMSSMPGQGTAPQVPGLAQGPSMPNPDELRRVLAQG